MDELLEQERINRLENNHEQQLQTFTSMLSLCESENDLLILLKLLSKKKNQIKISYQWLIDKVFETHKDGLNSAEFPEENVKFMVEILVNVIEGKLYLEKQRRDYANYIKEIYVKFDMFDKALEIAYNVPIETFSSLSLHEIAIYQLDVLKLCILTRDTIRAEIMVKKVKKKHLEAANDKVSVFMLALLKTDYFGMVGELLEATKILMEILDMPDSYDHKYEVPQFTHFFELRECADHLNRKVKEVFCVYASFFAILSTKRKEKAEYLEKLHKNKYNVEEIRKQIDYFRSIELIDKENVMLVLRRINSSYEKEILEAINDHNLRIISRFCASITFADLSALLMSPLNKCVEKICDEVNNHDLQCKIDQNNGVVFFENTEESYPGMINQVLLNVDKAVMNIRKETLKRQVAMMRRKE
ncbi:26S proteasome regulatory complex, subunit RPN5/PSMD12 [Trachipleistophora hominis]|uniref:26S proteasome regulatory complex, subunit RPN5/PSMD12 n=1 Tax=Trachipleistophora hominis TaxID=72359 RepID=L7JZX9_TRAHO|nr:26S proteasome regulatory complex, subunit RPN5/PSMD12 [Trachipleistophora hominis]